VFQIGQSLAEQRRRRHLSLEECESATRIRAKHLAALEEDRPGDLPDMAYARLFLRGYATFLDLDADALLAEFEERHGADPLRDQHRLVAWEPDEEAGRLGELRRWLVRPRGRSRRREASWLAAGLVGALALVVWMGARNDSSPPAAVVAPPAGVRAAPPVSAHHLVRSPARPAARLALTGAGTGGSYVRLQRGGPAGPVVYEGTIRPAQTVRLTLSGALWMRVGWAPDLQVALGGRTVVLPGGTGNFIVRRSGVAPAS
jgi:cytoskeleton protein RodZ